MSAEWASTTLKEAAGELFTDGDWVESKDQDPDGEVRLIQLADIGDGSFLDKSARFLTADKARELRCTFLQPGDLLIARMADPIARCCLFPGVGQPAATVVDVSIVRPGPDVDREYLAYAVSNPVFRSEALGSASGTTRSRISRSNLGAISLALPPLDEQRRIAEVLRSVDEAIAAKQAALSAIKLFKSTCREAAVTRFQHHAPSRLQSVLASIDAGWSPDCESEPANDGEWSILKTSAVVWQGYDDAENKRLPAHLEPRPHLEVVADDILITRAGPAERTGVIAIVRETAGRRMLSDKIIRLRVDRDKAVPLAIAELLSSEHVQAELIRSKSGMAASQTNISQKIVLGLEMHLPPLSEQQDFAEEMAALQDAIETGEGDLETMRQLKTALMSDLLSGHVRVPA